MTPERKIYFTRLLLEEKRDFDSGFTVRAFGETGTSGNHTFDYTRPSLEFCFRFDSPEKFALDYQDGVLCRNPFPHLLVKLPGRHYHAHIQGTRNAFFLLYSGTALERFEAAGLSFDPPGFPFEITAEIRELLDILHTFYEHTLVPGVPEKIDAYALMLIQAVFRQRLPAVNQQEHRIRRIASYLEYHFSRQPDWNTLMRENGLSRRTFYRNWRKLYQLTPADYLREVRLRNARTLLEREWSMPVAEAAAAVGFTNVSHFIQLYRKRYGVTPLESRR